ncbi:hypothetical protein BDC45DRAFT_524351 [Circinella umbellata]|nr:hypothetical protein BDC45DRAFT_524351 [Circinella umbellata]
MTFTCRSALVTLGLFLFPTWDICAIFDLLFLLYIYYSSLAYYILCNHNNYNRIILHQSFFFGMYYDNLTYHQE